MYLFQCKETYLKDQTIAVALSSDMQCETEDSKEDTVSETKYYPPKKRFLEKAEMVRNILLFLITYLVFFFFFCDLEMNNLDN